MAAAAASSSQPADLESRLLLTLNDGAKVSTTALAEAFGVTHQEIVGLIKSLEVDAYVLTEKHDVAYWKFSPEGEDTLKNGSPEAALVALLAAKGEGASVKQAEAEAALGADRLKIALANGLKSKLFVLQKGADGASLSLPAGGAAAAASFVDSVRALLQSVRDNDGTGLNAADIDVLKKRKLATLETLKALLVSKGPKFALVRAKPVTDFTREMLMDGSWATATYKPFNLTASDGREPAGGQLHPLLKVRQEFREILLELGFREMDTSAWVESSFWTFDSLFVPQQHPARDSQDTFFLSKPAKGVDPDPAYFQRVKEAHEAGYQSPFDMDESRRNVLRTHTTSVSSYVLAQMAEHAKTCKEGFQPGKYFSIDRVFRNEEMDKTHLCEFHQVEGFVIDRNLSLANMMHTLHSFFKKIGIHQLRFKPAYNPYTEPSMEIFGFHSGLGKWIEVGNSGVFRPEMLRPMGFPEDVSAIAWGLSVERPTMIKYEIKNIHELFGHKVDLRFIRKAKIARY
jgi:phenylalanyl-tRNA synthetase alpha chain